MMPLTKYFCRNGYTMIIGRIEMTIAAICTERAVVGFILPAAAEFIDDMNCAPVSLEAITSRSR